MKPVAPITPDHVNFTPSFVRFDTIISVGAVGGKGSKNTSDNVDPPTFVAVTIICS